METDRIAHKVDGGGTAPGSGTATVFWTDVDLAFFGKVNASISHELKNIMAIISETAGLMNDLMQMAAGGDHIESEMLMNGSKDIIVHRRDELRASKMLADRVLANPKVRVEWNSTVSDILGQDFVTGVRLKDAVDGNERDLECKGVFMAIGHTPNTGFLQEALPLKPTGYLEVEPGSTRTGIPGVFGAGDVMDDTFRQAVTAAGTGCMAALEAEKWLAEND